jgi:putative ABC transport system permease protein
MGIRSALGATRANLHGLVFRHGFALALSGLVIGFAAAAAFTRWLESLLFDTTPADPAAWATMIAVIVSATGLACLLPARRAASASPTIALRNE